VEKLIAAGSNVNLAKTTDGASPILIADQHGHDPVVEHLIASRCNVDLALTTNGAKAILLAAQHTRIVTMIHNYLHPCTVCKKYGHDATGCWINAENKLKAAAKMKSDAEAILKSKKSNKKAYVASSAAKDHPL
jgi:ankyrin repeat protein